MIRTLDSMAGAQAEPGDRTGDSATYERADDGAAKGSEGTCGHVRTPVR